MRFLMIMKATKDSEAGVMPREELLAEMGRFNEEMLKAGVMIDGTGLQATSKGARIRFPNGKPEVIPGPFPFTTELIAGYWIINVKSLEEAIDWAKRVPPQPDTEVELRQFFELEDFAPGEAIDHHKKMAEQLANKK